MRKKGVSDIYFWAQQQQRHRPRRVNLLLCSFAFCTVTYVVLSKYSFYLIDTKSFKNGTSWLTSKFLHSSSDSVPSSTLILKPDLDLHLDLDSNSENRKNKKSEIEIVVATVSCGTSKSEYLSTLLKSAVLFTLDKQTSLHFIIFTDQENFYNLNKTMKAFVDESKSNGYAWNFSYKLQATWFPSPEETGINWRAMYADCSTQRLFFPSILPDVDSLIYLDADTIVLGNLTQVWTEFSRMNSDEMIALGPDSMRTYHGGRKIPYVGEIGLNAGVTFMNLTRLRQFRFEKKVQEQYQIYKKFIKFADQDLINIVFHDHPKTIRVLKCSFNFIWVRCFARQFCKDSRNDGILIVHGAGGSFKRNADVPTSGFPLIYEKMRNFTLSESPEALLDHVKDEWYAQKLYCASATPETLVRNAQTYFKNLRELLPNSIR